MFLNAFIKSHILFVVSPALYHQWFLYRPHSHTFSFTSNLSYHGIFRITLSNSRLKDQGIMHHNVLVSYQLQMDLIPLPVPGLHICVTVAYLKKITILVGIPKFVEVFQNFVQIVWSYAFFKCTNTKWIFLLYT